MLGSGLDSLRPGLLTSYLRKANRRRKRILTYRRLLSATARSVPDNFLPDVRRFLREAAEDEKTVKKRTAMTWPYRKALVHALRVNGQAATKPAHINQKISARQYEGFRRWSPMHCRSGTRPLQRVFREQGGKFVVNWTSCATFFRSILPITMTWGILRKKSPRSA